MTKRTTGKPAKTRGPKTEKQEQQSKGQPTNNKQQQQVITANLLACSGYAEKNCISQISNPI
jgi:hypothetical protein